MQRAMHIHSPEVRAVAKVIYPNHKTLSVKQREIALLLIHIVDAQSGADKDKLYTLAELAKMYRADYTHVPANEKKAIRHNVKLFLKGLATASSRLAGEFALTIVPVPEKAWIWNEAGAYPPPLVRSGLDGVCADDLFIPGWAIYGASVTSNPDGAVPTAYTKANKRKATGINKINIAREEGWSSAGLLTDDICEVREIPTQKQLESSLLFLSVAKS